MSLLLAVFTQEAHEDILLPAINNADFQVTLSDEKFNIPRPLTLELEILDGLWQFKENNHYAVKKGEESWQEKPIACGDVLSVIFARTRITVLVVNHSDQIGSMEKFDTLRLGELVVGKDANSDICYASQEIVSRHHFSLYFNGSSATLEDFSVNGVYLNGKRIRGKAELRFGDVISAFGLKLVYLIDTVAVNAGACAAQISQRLMDRQLLPQAPEPAPEKEAGAEPEHSSLFHRSPRKIISLHTEPEEIEAPPQKQAGNRKPVWMVIGPSFTMAIPMLLGTGFMIVARSMAGSGSNAFMYVGLITAITSAIIGVTWAIINLNYSKKEEKEAELLRLQKYGQYLMECAERIRGKYEFNRNALQEMYPDAATCCNYWQNTQELWSRNRSHQDFLSCRLGLGDIPFQVPISIPKKKFTLNEDELSERPAEIQQTYSTLLQVPINVDLFAHRVVGLVGRNRADIARSIITQLAANNCYTDVRMAVLGDGSTGADWSFMKWLPHVWNSDRSQRYVALKGSEVSGVCYELTQIFRSRSDEAENSTSSRKAVLPTQYVVLVESCSLLESEPIAKYLYERPETIGVTTLLLANSFEDLPNSCGFIIESSHNFSGMYAMVPNGEQPQKIRFDYVSARAAERLARGISDIRVAETGNGSNLPDSLTFLEMLGVSRLQELDVLDNWKKNRTYQTMQAMVGWKVGGTPCYLNIHEKHHGPHGLIAGTTGSGKSETLQTYILSLAINYSPLDVGFFIIDFKGGGMANLFDKLPHMLGTISNLSGNQVRRAMVSIKSENMRRQRIFNEYGVNHIDAYTKLVKSGEASLPIPHMFIIIDEFAELKREQPEFMRELISVAQVGRSLGVHLILATQKPSGTVDDNIWSNTKFRLCLRVADKQDSKDMLHKPDAAYLTQAGRCYLQVGNDEIYELFQSGWSGAVYDEDMGSVKSNFAVQLENSGKVVMTGGSTRAKKMAQRKRQWIAQLVTCCRQAQTQTDQPLLDSVFRSLQQAGIDYADSVFNRRQMSDFLEQYGSLFALDAETAAEKIIREAERSGRKLPECKDKTQLDAIVEYLGEVAQKNDYNCNLRLWMPVLPEKILLDDIPGKKEPVLDTAQWHNAPVKTTLRATVGMVDDPQNQAQFPLTVDFLRDGHLAVCGGISSGKSVLMQTIAYSLVRSHTPDMLNLYMIDYSSQMLAPFEELPHTGGVVYEGENEKLNKLFLLMQKMLQKRKAQFRGGSFLQYITAHGNEVPAVVLMIDGYASFREKTDNAYEAQLLELARDGAGFGIFLCISSGGFGTGELQAKIGDKIRQVLTLEMDSKYSYGECLRTMKFDVLPEAGVHGRGLAVCNESVLEYQVGLAAAGDDYQRSEAIQAWCSRIDQLWSGKRAMPVPQIPKDPTWEQFEKLDEYKELVLTDRFLPLGYRREDASIYSVDLSKTFCYQISGRERSGKSVFLRNVACAAKARGGKIYLIDKIGQNTEGRTAELVGAEYINTVDDLFAAWKDIILTINERHVLHKQLVDQGLEDSEIFEGMSKYQQIFVLLADMQDFINVCANPGAGKTAMTVQVDNIIAKGAMHQVFFFGAVGTQDLAAVSLQQIYRSFVKGKQGVHLGGELNSQKMLSYRNIPFAEQTRSLKPGLGYVPDAEDTMNVDPVVIPMNKGIRKDGGEKA
ncbi:MAG: type VII secretion protein EssC [Oscillospiraceae bacterium]|nr:type VII secretion protein EssC [Oscillospiraceae bacterium]